MCVTCFFNYSAHALVARLVGWLVEWLGGWVPNFEAGGGLTWERVWDERRLFGGFFEVGAGDQVKGVLELARRGVNWDCTWRKKLCSRLGVSGCHNYSCLKGGPSRASSN